MEEILSLFNEEKYLECIKEINNIIITTNNKAALNNILGKCYYKIAVNKEDESDNNFLLSFNCFSNAITENPQLLEAILYRAYLIFYDLVPNQKKLGLQDANAIIKMADDGNKLQGYQYQYLANYHLKDDTAAIESLSNRIVLINTFYKNNQPERLKIIAIATLQMGDVYRFIKNDELHSLDFYEKGFYLYPYNFPFNCFLVKFALLYKRYNLASHVAEQIISFQRFENNETILREIINDFGELIDNGCEDFCIVKIYLRALHNDDEFDQMKLLI